MLQSAVKTYRILCKDKLDNKSEGYILQNLYKNLCQHLLDDGYGTEQIKTMCLSHSPYIRGLDEFYREAFLSVVMPNEAVKDNLIKDALTEEKYLSYLQQENLSALNDYYTSIDVETLAEMLDIGYSEREVSEAYSNNNLFSDIVQSKSMQSFYEKNVYALLHSKREEIIDAQIEEGTEEYLRLIKTVPAGLEQDSAENDYNIFREGNAIISLMLTKRLSAETITRILLANSPYKGSNREIYVKKLIDQCQHVKQNYLQIKSVNPNLEEAEQAVDIYRIYAKEYMKKNDLYLLNYDNDFEILEALRADMIPEEYLKPAFLEGSPVAIQPGRDKDNYIESLFSEQENSTNLIISNNNNYLTVADIYRGLIENADKKLKQAGVLEGVNKSRLYYDCLVAYELIKENHFEFKDIRKAIEDNCPASFNKANHAEITLNTVSEILDREQNLLKLPEKPVELYKGMTYDEATDKYTPRDIFKSVLYEHVALNPSITNRLLNRNVNIDLAESVLYKFPDFDLDVLKELLESTPFGLLAHRSNSPDDKKYGFITIKKAKERLAKQNVINNREQSLLDTYSSTYRTAGQGLTEFSSLNSVLYRQGQSALKELNRGMNIYDIKRGILETAERNLIDMPIELFADKIIKMVQAVQKRMLFIQELPTIENPRQAELFYQQRLADYFHDNRKFNKESDIAAVQQMILADYPKSEILQSINEFSPFAIFPGNTEKYPYTIIQTAEQNIEKERKKLRSLILGPRLEKEPQAEEAYMSWKKNIREMINLDHDSRMDEAIIRVMLLEGYEDKDIENTVQENSPCRKLQNNYSENIIKRVVNYLLKDAPATPEIIKWREKRKVIKEKSEDIEKNLQQQENVPIERGRERGLSRDRKPSAGA